MRQSSDSATHSLLNKKSSLKVEFRLLAPWGKEWKLNAWRVCCVSSTVLDVSQALLGAPLPRAGKVGIIIIYPNR